MVIRCQYLDDKGRRCQKKGKNTLRVHLNPEDYKYPCWVEIRVCKDHYKHYQEGPYG
jgi:hypothetical protein